MKQVGGEKLLKELWTKCRWGSDKTWNLNGVKLDGRCDLRGQSSEEL
ncbi:MAG: hypothetical protein ACTS47_01540 [Candidatus Hodgkinia cicadicola]